MNDLNRRQFLKGTLAKLVHAAGSVTLASAAITRAQSTEVPPADDAGRDAADLQQRADELAAAIGPGPHAAGGRAPVEPVQLRRRSPVRDLRDRRRRPGPWRNGLWGNGGWRNSPWLNGGWPNIGWSNFPWGNGGWRNGGWRNW